MEQELTSEYQNPTEKIYKDKEVWVGTYLGGTLVAGYMIAANFKAFGEAGKARTTWIASILATIALFFVVFYAPYIDRVPNFLFPLVYTGIAVMLMQLYQGEQIRCHFRAGGKIHSWWRTIAVTVIGVIVTAIPFVGMGVLLESIANANVAAKNYGAVQHEISFDKTNITESEVDALADALTKTKFFDNEGKWTLYARKIENTYEISIATTKASAKNEKDLAYFAYQRNEMQRLFPNNKIVFNLVVDDFTNVVERLK